MKMFFTVSIVEKKNLSSSKYFENKWISISYSTHLLSFLVGGRGVGLHVVELRLHAVQPLVNVVVGAGESRGQLQGLLQGAEGLAAAGRHLSVARLDAVQLLLDQENFLTCRRTSRSGS